MKGITLIEPYATLVACGAKKFETRSWQTSYHHDLAIHASKKWSKAIHEDWCRCRDIIMSEASAEVIAGWPLIEPWKPESLGCVIAIARLVYVEPMSSAPPGLDRHFGTYGPGRFAWRLSCVEPLASPVPWKGSLGLWVVPEELEALIRSQIRGEAR